MSATRWSKLFSEVEERGRHLTRSVGKWAGRTLPRWGAQLDSLSAQVVGDEPVPPSAPAAAPRAVEFEVDLELDFDLPVDEEDEVSSPEPQLSHSGALPDLEVPSDLPLSKQLEVFAEAVRGATGSYAAFVADAQGLPLASRNGTEDQIAITAALDRALQPIRESLRGTPQGSVAVEIDRNNVLQVIWVNTESGRYVVGLVLPQSLGGDFIESIRAQIAPLFVESRESAA